MVLTKPRKDFQTLIDRYLLLCTVSESERKGWIGVTKMQKIVFYAEYLINNAKQRGFNLLFRRHNFGPYSDDLEKDINFLASIEYVSLDEKNGMYLGDFGKKILDDTSELIRENNWVLEKIKSSARKIAPLSTENALEYIYALPVESSLGKTVEDLPDGATICRPLEEEDAQQVFTLDEEWTETLAILLDMDTAMDLYRIVEKSNTTPPIPYLID